MNEQAEKALSDLITQFVEGVDGAVAFSKAQLPEVIDQLLMWHFVESLIEMASFFVISLVSFIMIFVMMKLDKKKNPDVERTPDNIDTFEEGASYAFIGISGICFVLFLFNINFTWLQIIVAPKLYLIEYASSLIK